MWQRVFQSEVRAVIDEVYDALTSKKCDDKVLTKIESDLVRLIDLVNKITGRNLNYHRIRPLRVDIKSYPYHLFDGSDKAVDDFAKFVAGVKFLMEIYKAKKEQKSSSLKSLKKPKT